MRKTEILRQLVIILIAVICLVVVGIRVYEIKKNEKLANKPIENVAMMWYNGHSYLYFKNIKTINHNPDCPCNFRRDSVVDNSDVMPRETIKKTTSSEND